MDRKKRFWFYLRSYRNKSLIAKNFIMILIIFIMPMTGMGMIVYHNMNRIVEREVSTISMDSLLNTKGTIDTVLRDADTIATQISIQPGVRVFFMSDLGFSYIGQRYSEVYRDIKAFPRVHRYIDTIYIYSSKSNIVLSTRDSGPMESFQDRSWYDTYEGRKDNLPWIEARIKNNIYPYYISVVRPAYLYNDERLGAVIININAEELGDMIGGKKDLDSKEVFIIDENDNVIFDYKWENITKNIKDIPDLGNIASKAETGSQITIINGEKYIVSTVVDNVKKWKYISLVSLRYYGEKVDWVQGFLAAFLIVSIILAIIIAVFLAYKSFVPIRNIIQLLESPDEWKLLNKNRGMNELKYIANNIVKMVSSNKILQKELESQMTLLDKAHTSALQAQINPHFLYNTLESINWLAALSMGKKNRVSGMISNLSKLLRLSLETDDEIVTIEREIEHAKCYIDIMKIRYSDNFDVIWDIPENLLEYKILKLCLQPVIENCLEHGLKLTDQGGSILIKGRIVDSRIIIEVQDNGVGLDEEIINTINTDLENDYILKTEHIGLRNIAQRCKLVFGQEYGILLKKGESMGLISYISIPALK